MGSHINATDFGFNNTADLLRYPREVIAAEAGADMFGAVLLMTIWTVSFLSALRYGPLRGFAFASFITSISALLFYMMDLISDLAMGIPVVMVLISIVMMYTTRGE